MRALLFLAACLGGLSNPMQSAANVALNKGLGQPLLAASVVYAVACLSLLLAALVAGYPAHRLARIGDLPWWSFAGGVCNATFVICAAVATRGIGSAAFTVTTLVCAAILSLALNRFGLLGLAQRGLTWPRLGGAALAVGGVALIALG